MEHTFDRKGNFLFVVFVVLASIVFWVLYAVYDFLTLNQQVSFLFFNEPLHFSDALIFNISYFSFLTRVVVITIFILAVLVIRKTIHSLQDKNQELLEIQEKIQHSELIYRMLFDTNNDPILMLKNWSIYKCNRKALSFFGYTSREKLLSLHFLDLFPESQKDGSLTKTKLLKLQKKIAMNDFNFSPLSLDCKTAENSLKPALITISPFVLKNELFCQVLLRDLSAEQTYEKELMALRTKAHEANLSKHRIFTIVQHELNPPLKELPYTLEMAQKQLSPSSTSPVVPTLDKIYQSLQSLSNNIEEMASLDTPNITFHKEPVQLYDLKKNLIEKYSPLFQEKKIDFSVQCISQDYCCILDREKLNQALSHLLQNIYHHSQPSRNVSIQLEIKNIIQSDVHTDNVTEDMKGSFLLTIKDASSGIPQITNAFHLSSPEDLSSTLSADSRLLDLDLSISSKLIEVLEGSLSVENHDHQGCIFTILLDHTPILQYSESSNPQVDTLAGVTS
jgi:PAS domain S-box-containing protein